jgi:hypothetical protein
MRGGVDKVRQASSGQHGKGEEADNGKAIRQQMTRQEEGGREYEAGKLGSGCHDDRGGGVDNARRWLTASGSCSIQRSMVLARGGQ